MDMDAGVQWFLFKPMLLLLHFDTRLFTWRLPQHTRLQGGVETGGCGLNQPIRIKAFPTGANTHTHMHILVPTMQRGFWNSAACRKLHSCRLSCWSRMHFFPTLTKNLFLHPHIRSENHESTFPRRINQLVQLVTVHLFGIQNVTFN